MFPPDCVANRLCSRVAEEVNGQHEFAGGGVAQQARLAKHVEMGTTYASRLPKNSLKWFIFRSTRITPLLRLYLYE